MSRNPTPGEGSHHYPRTDNYGTLHQGNKITNVFNEEDRITEILRSLEGIPERDRLMTGKPQRAKGSCEWLTKSQEYLNWRNDERVRILRISGSPGKGKTMLALYLLDQLKSAKRENEDILYFFCENRDDTRNQTSVILRDFCNQLLTQQKGEHEKELIKHIDQHFTPSRNKNDPPVCTTTSATILETLVQHYNRSITCLIDGLDECDNESEVERFLEVLQKLTNAQSDQPSACNFKLLLVSRVMSDHMSHQLGECASIDLDSGHDHEVQLDVERYISEKVDQQTQLSDVTREKLRDILQERHGQTFLWIGYVWDEVKGKTWQEMREIIRSIPPGLDSIYVRILEQIKARLGHGGIERVVRVLKWVVLSQRPLTLEEMAIAVEVPESEDQSRRDQLKDILTSCGYLFDKGRRKVRLLHQSASEFLQNKERIGQDLELFYVDQAEGHAELTKFCLAHIQEMFPSDQESNVPLLDYTRDYWPEHAKFVTKSYEYIFDLEDSFWQKQSAVRERWWKCYWEENGGLATKSIFFSSILYTFSFHPSILPSSFRIKLDSYKSPVSNFTPLHLAAYFGIDALASVLTSANHSVHVTDSYGRTPLSWASERGHELLVGRLLTSHANIMVIDEFALSPLLSAVAGGHQKVVLQFINYKANTEAKELDTELLLVEAIYSGSKYIDKALLEQTSYASGQLNEALLRAKRTMAVLKSMDIKKKQPISKPSQRSPLTLAPESQGKEAVHVLLQHGILQGYFEPLMLLLSMTVQNGDIAMQDLLERRSMRHLDSHQR